MSNFLKRIVVSIILIPLFLYLLFLNNIFYFVLLLIIFLFSIFELSFLLKKKKLIFLLIISILLIFLISLINLRGKNIENYYYLIWILFIIWLSDIGGYFFGKLFGGKNFTSISPNKTISGLIGSLILSQFAFFILSHNITILFSFRYFAIQAFISLCCIFGDLFFSYIKRKNNIKDYSNLIPGHGGLLDRIDGMIFSIIAANIIKISNVY